MSDGAALVWLPEDEETIEDALSSIASVSGARSADVRAGVE